MKELEEKKSEEALLPRKQVDLQDLLSFESCRSSAVDFFEEISLESQRKMQDEQEVTSETSWNATRGKEVDEWRLEPEGETETPESKVLWNGVEGVPGHPDGEGRHERVQVKSSRRESEAPGEKVKKLRAR